MSEISVDLKAIRRDTGKKAVKAIRRQGKVPGVYYIKTGESFPITVNALDLRPIVYTAQTKIVNLFVEGEKDMRECVLKHVDFDPVTDKVTHIDLYGIIRGQYMHIEVPVIIHGTAKGVREGGVLQQTLRNIEIECFPRNLPNSIDLDISNLGIGQSITVKDLNIPDVKFLIPSDTSIVSVITPRVGKETEGKPGETATPAVETVKAKEKQTSDKK